MLSTICWLSIPSEVKELDHHFILIFFFFHLILLGMQGCGIMTGFANPECIIDCTLYTLFITFPN